MRLQLRFQASRRAGVLQAKNAQSSQVKSSQGLQSAVKSSQVKSRAAKRSQVKSSQVKGCKAQSSQVKSSQGLQSAVKSSQVKSRAASAVKSSQVKSRAAKRSQTVNTEEKAQRSLPSLFFSLPRPHIGQNPPHRGAGGLPRATYHEECVYNCVFRPRDAQVHYRPKNAVGGEIGGGGCILQTWWIVKWG